MAGKAAAKSSIPSSTSANKDLSCLRCRKKKAKCSKTRPTCTRCARSNQPCEYPDAPPNLTDLSQKVLTLYDTLRELEGEFLVKYMQSMDEETHTHDTLSERNHDFDQQQQQQQPLFSSNSHHPAAPATIECHHERQKRIKQEPDMIKDEQQQQQDEEQEPAGWSMSLTSQGLSIHAVTRNLHEFNEFAKTLSRQIMRDFGPSYLPAHWDPDAEGYSYEDDYDDDDDELAEDEYLVTVPVFATSSLLFNVTPNLLPDSTCQQQQDKTPARSVMRTLLNGAETLTLPVAGAGHGVHSSAAPPGDPDAPAENVPARLRAPPPPPPPAAAAAQPSAAQYRHCDPGVHPDGVRRVCDAAAAHPAAGLPAAADVAVARLRRVNPYPVILSGILLAWIDAELASDEFKADTMVHIALRVLCASDWKSEEPAWQILIAALLYLDVYSATFRFRRPQLQGEGSAELWKAAVQMREPSRWDASFREAGIVLEARLMSLLSKVVSLFYEVDEERSPSQRPHEINVRKIDVDEVLTLVRDVELWEHELPDWAKWGSSATEQQQHSRTGLKMHMHMIHNMVKILLFRPFSTDLHQQQESEQTFTKTTFLDMSTSSADRLATCLCHIHEYGFTGFWTRAAGNLVRDVAKRVLRMFDSDQDIVNQLDVIQQRLERAEFIKKEMQ
ncbi:hypothetical protein MBANPS3_011097 [Mucor bainieri]